MIGDIVFDAPIPHFDVRPNSHRRLKNAQSRRRIPIHPELMRLGLRSYIEDVAKLGYDMLFPELLPASGTSSLGDQLYDDWLPVLRQSVPGASELGLTFHSLRHFGNDTLVDARVMTELRQDILGHAGSSEATERYRSEAALRRTRSALLKVATVTESLKSHPVTLRRSVMLRMRRQSRAKRSAEV